MTATGTSTYLVECYVPGIEAPAVEAAAGRARASATALRDEGRQVEYSGAILVRDDEVVFHLFAAEDPAAVRDASVRARVPFERIVEAVAIGEGEASA
jgi:hypothetical protein